MKPNFLKKLLAAIYRFTSPAFQSDPNRPVIMPGSGGVFYTKRKEQHGQS